MAGVAETAKLVASLELKDNFSRGIASASKSLSGLEKRFGKIGGIAGRGASQAGKNIEKGVAVGAIAAAGALGYAAHKAIEWESAVAGINKTSDLTTEQLKEITDGLIAISNKAPTSAVDLASIAEAGGALGVARENLLAFTETVALLGATTDVSIDDAATSLGQLGNVLGLTAADYDNFASALVDLGNKGASTESAILEVAKRSGLAAKTFGLTTAQTLAFASAAANLGIESEAAGTNLSKMYGLAQGAFQKGDKKLQEITGKSGKALKKLFADDPKAAISDLLRTIGKLKGSEQTDAITALFGNNQIIRNLVRGLAVSIDQNLNPALETGTKAWQENTAAAAEAAKRYATTESQLKTLGNNVDNAATIIGSQLLPLVNELATEAVGWLQTHQDDVKNFGKDLAKGLRDAVAWIKQLDFKAIGSALQTAAGFAKGLVDAFLGMPAWVQTAVITGWGLNKLTGGAVGDIVGELGKGLIKGVLGMTAGTVNLTAGTVVGGGAPVAPSAGGGNGLANLLGLITPAALGAVGSKAVADFTNAEFSNAGFQGADFVGPGSGDPFGITSAIHNIGEVVKLLNQKPAPPIDPARFNSLAGKQIDDTINATEGVQTSVDTMKGKIADDLATNKTAIDGAATAARDGAGRVASATTSVGAGIEATIRANRPITNVDVNISGAGMQSSVDVQTRYGSPGGDRNFDLSHQKVYD